MFRSLWNAASGMEAQQTSLDVITNNLANVNTTGFKRQRANFQDLMYQTLVPPGEAQSLLGNQSPTGMQVGLGVRSGSVQKIFLQGSFRQTNNPLDLAIQGNGFFRSPFRTDGPLTRGTEHSALTVRVVLSRRTGCRQIPRSPFLRMRNPSTFLLPERCR